MKQNKKSKWADFAEEIKGTISKKTSDYLDNCSKEIRENFEFKKTKLINLSIDKTIKESIPINTKKAEESKEAMEKLGLLIDEDIKNMPLLIIRENYYTK